MYSWSIRYRSEPIYGSPAELIVDERPWWAVAVSTSAEFLDARVLHHRWCSPFEWTWYFPLGTFQHTDEGNFVRSLGSVLYSSFNFLVTLEERQATRAMRVDLDREWLARNGQSDDLEEEFELGS
jgi:hypothetical protein